MVHWEVHQTQPIPTCLRTTDGQRDDSSSAVQWHKAEVKTAPSRPIYQTPHVTKYVEVSIVSCHGAPTALFSSSIVQTANLFGEVMLYLGKVAFPSRHRSVSERAVDMFHSATDQTSKDRIIKTFHEKDSPIRLLICTVAFGMGINIPDIRSVIHWGCSSSVLGYWQEVGRCGRDGLPAEARLLVTSHPG